MQAPSFFLSGSSERDDRRLPSIREPQGRTTDFVIARNGTVMHGLALVYVLRGVQGLRGFKIVQESLDLTRVLTIPDKELSPGSEQYIQDAFRARLGDTVEVQVERVAEIPPEQSGKLRYVQSKVQR